MQEAGDHSRYAKADCHRKCPSTGSAKMGRISSLTNTDTQRLQANDCRAMVHAALRQPDQASTPPFFNRRLEAVRCALS